MDFLEEVREKGAQAKQAARQLAFLSTAVKNKALFKLAEALLENMPAILAANGLDVAAAKEKGYSPALLDRLLLSKARVESMAEALSVLPLYLIL